MGVKVHPPLLAARPDGAARPPGPPAPGLFLPPGSRAGESTRAPARASRKRPPTPPRGPAPALASCVRRRCLDARVVVLALAAAAPLLAIVGPALAAPARADLPNRAARRLAEGSILTLLVFVAAVAAAVIVWAVARMLRVSGSAWWRSAAERATLRPGTVRDPWKEAGRRAGTDRVRPVPDGSPPPRVPRTERTKRVENLGQPPDAGRPRPRRGRGPADVPPDDWPEPPR